MSDVPQVQELMGAPGSPYTRKMLAYMRFRRIPYQFEIQTRIGNQDSGSHTRQRVQPKVPLLPTFFFKDEAGNEVAVTDSTPLIQRFEGEYEGRATMPTDPALAFVNMILEDYGDEWLTKAMFHYRWHYAADIKKAGDILPRWRGISQPEEQAQKMGEFVRQRQIERLSYVGSNDVTKPVIEESFKRFILLLDKHLTHFPFLMGERPGSCDFAIYGQLTCLALFDPTPSAIVLNECPRVYAWVEVLEDLSGYQVNDSDWIEIDETPETLKAILNEVGRLYAPYLIGNAEAVAGKANLLEMELDNRQWQQTPFTYQAKCLQWLREAYAALDANDKIRVNNFLEGTGVLRLFG